LIAASQARFDRAERHLLPVRQPTQQFNRVKASKRSSSRAVNSRIFRVIAHRKSAHISTLIFLKAQTFLNNYNINSPLPYPFIIAFLSMSKDSPIQDNFRNLFFSGFTDGLKSSKLP
jgi:hypothetical protein